MQSFLWPFLQNSMGKKRGRSWQQLLLLTQSFVVCLKKNGVEVHHNKKWEKRLNNFYISRHVEKWPKNLRFLISLDFLITMKKGPLQWKWGLLSKSDTKLIDQVVYWFPFLCLTHELDLLYCPCVPHFCVSVWEFPANFSEKMYFLKEHQQPSDSQQMMNTL